MNRSIPRMVLDRCRRTPEATLLMERFDGRYHPILCREFAARLSSVANALEKSGIEAGDRVAIVGPNSPRWALADLAALLLGAVTVPVYHNDSLSATEHILEDSGARLLFCEETERAASILKKQESLPKLERIVTMDGQGGSKGLTDLSDWQEETNVPTDDLDRRLERLNPSDPATLVYTSGTTGKPKGAILTHDNLLSNIEACAELFPLGESDRCLSFLPLAHVFERMAGYYFMLYQGVTIAYAESIATVPRDIRDADPTVIISVPRLFEKIYDRIQTNLSALPRMKRTLIRQAIDLSLDVHRRRNRGQGATAVQAALLKLADRLFFTRIRQRIGEQLRFFVSGGAPLRIDIAEFFLSIGLPIYEGYGLTETSPVIAANSPQAHRPGTVGKPLPDTDVKIGEEGEILVRGPGVFAGYWNRPKATEEALENGWFHTGDIGEITEEGYLRITDRKKNLIVTAGGENIAPQNIESTLRDIPLLGNALVYGDRRPYLTALLTPDLEALHEFARKKGLDIEDDCELVSHDEVLDRVRELVDRKQQDLPSIERIKRFTLLSRDFSQDEGEITPTMKLKRPVICNRFESVIEGMYAAQDHERHDAGLCVVEELGPEES